MPQVANHPHPELSYLDAAKVQSPAGALSELELVSADGERVGSIAGVVIDAGARRVRYYNVQSDGWRHYLIDADQLAQVDPEQKVLRLLEDGLSEVRDLTSSSFRRYSDEDVLAAVFSKVA